MKKTSVFIPENLTVFGPFITDFHLPFLSELACGVPHLLRCS